MNHYLETDVLIIGSGISGSVAAMRLAEQGLDVTVLSKEKDCTGTNTHRAQGGIARLQDDESPEIFIKDICKSGAGENYLPAVKQVVQDSPGVVDEILVKRLRIPFSAKGKGKLDLAREGAHSTRRVLNVKDKTGQLIQERLAGHMAGQKNIRMLYSHVAVDLLSYPHHSDRSFRIFEEPRVIGAYVLNEETGQIMRIFSRKVVLATGGLSSIFLHSTNPDDAVGNGVAMAHRLGARLANLEYTQFHPTSLHHHETTHFLISEAVRGEGARLMNSRGVYFMKKYSELEDLAPRDIVSRAIFEEILNDNNDYVYLNIADFARIDVKKRFPTISRQCEKYNIDISRDPIPVVPAAHYSCGGVVVDLEGRTSVRNLYAVGEVSATGVHGANRLASVSLLEGLVWGYRAAEHILDTINGEEVPYRVSETPAWKYPGGEEDVDPALVKQDRITIRYTMWNYSGIIRRSKRLNRARADLEYLQHRILKFYQKTRIDKRIIDLRDSVQTAQLVVYAALKNRRSRGAHYREN